MRQVPALVRFTGHPEVTESGELIYVFPSLQRTGRWQVTLCYPPLTKQDNATVAHLVLLAAFQGPVRACLRRSQSREADVYCPASHAETCFVRRDPQKPPPPPEREAALERQWAFSSASEGQRLGTIALGVANLIGVVFLGNLLRDPAVARAVTQSSLGFMTGLLPFLQACPTSAQCPSLNMTAPKRASLHLKAVKMRLLTISRWSF